MCRVPFCNRGTYNHSDALSFPPVTAQVAAMTYPTSFCFREYDISPHRYKRVSDTYVDIFCVELFLGIFIIAAATHLPPLSQL